MSGSTNRRPSFKKNDQIDISQRSLSIARLIDRQCRIPGQYQITITVPSHKRDSWQVEISRMEKTLKIELGR